MIFHARNPAFIPVVGGWPWPEFASARHPLADLAIVGSSLVWLELPGASHSPLWTRRAFSATQQKTALRRFLAPVVAG